MMRIASAIATSTAAAAEVVTVSAVEKLKCRSFTAEIEDWEDDASSATTAYRVKTGQSVTVWNEFTEAMVVGDRIKIAYEYDRWVTIVWPCEE